MTTHSDQIIMRTWRGAVRRDDAEAYLAHQADTGIQEYPQTPGNLGAQVITRDLNDLIEVTTVSYWESMDAVRGFAGDSPEQARFYPGDDELLAEKDLDVHHFTVLTSDLDDSLLRRG